MTVRAGSYGPRKYPKPESSGPSIWRIARVTESSLLRGPSSAAPPERRNADQADRAALVIDPGPRTLHGPGESAAFDTGRFLGTKVPLGEMRTDSDGRLLVLGGFGHSDGPANELRHFSNNDRWFDDMSDGPVTASVQPSRGPPVHASPAWVIVAPPDFAPQITNFVTLYDVAFQVAVERGWLTVPQKPSFTRDVLPILSRPSGTCG